MRRARRGDAPGNSRGSLERARPVLLGLIATPTSVRNDGRARCRGLLRGLCPSARIVPWGLSCAPSLRSSPEPGSSHAGARGQHGPEGERQVGPRPGPADAQRPPRRCSEAASPRRRDGVTPGADRRAAHVLLSGRRLPRAASVQTDGARRRVLIRGGT